MRQRPRWGRRSSPASPARPDRIVDRRKVPASRAERGTERAGRRDDTRLAGTRVATAREGIARRGRASAMRHGARTRDDHPAPQARRPSSPDAPLASVEGESAYAVREAVKRERQPRAEEDPPDRVPGLASSDQRVRPPRTSTPRSPPPAPTSSSTPDRRQVDDRDAPRRHRARSPPEARATAGMNSAQATPLTARPPFAATARRAPVASSRRRRRRGRSEASRGRPARAAARRSASSVRCAS